jgi:hypothetical protein
MCYKLQGAGNVAPVLTEALRALFRELYVPLTRAAERIYLFLRRYLGEKRLQMTVNIMVH